MCPIRSHRRPRYVILSEQKASRRIFAPGPPLQSNRCEDPSTPYKIFDFLRSLRMTGLLNEERADPQTGIRSSGTPGETRTHYLALRRIRKNLKNCDKIFLSSSYYGEIRRIICAKVQPIFSNISIFAWFFLFH